MCRQVRFAKQQASSTNLDGEAKQSRGRSQSPLVASAEAKSPAFRKDKLCLKDQLFGRAHLARHSIDVGKSSLGALLRKREVTGRDASLPAPLLSAFGILVARRTVGALPQTPPEALPLDSARGNFPLDPFARLSWFLYHTPYACCALGVLPTITPRALPLPPPHPSPDPAGTALHPPDAGRGASSRYYRPAPHGLPSPPSRLPSPRGSRFPSRRPCR